jgi:hypothetical protein
MHSAITSIGLISGIYTVLRLRLGLTVGPHDRQINLTAFAAVFASQERLQVSDQHMAGPTKPLDCDEGRAPAWAVDTDEILDRQVLDPGLKERAHLLSRAF